MKIKITYGCVAAYFLFLQYHQYNCKSWYGTEHFRFSTVAPARLPCTGFGEMALSNAFGTLNAGLLLCLAAPWLLALVITPDNPVAIEEDLLVSVAGLVLAGTLMIVVLVWNHWTISQNMCYVFIILYLGFLVPLLILQVITEAETKNEAN